jgi:hypothetical protein
VVHEIVITPLSPFVSGVLERWQFVARFLNQSHVTTRREVVRGFLTLQEGQPCSEFRRAESERILRALPFIADALVEVQPDSAGGVRVLVETIDELTLVVSASASTSSPMLRSLSVGEGNLLGEGVYAAADWRNGTFGRDGFGARYANYQVFGRPYQIQLEGQRYQLGDQWRASFGHPFITDLQRIAWAVEGGSSNSYIDFDRDSGDRVALVSEREFGQVGGIVRVGPPGRLSLFGISMSIERSQVRDLPQLLTDSGPVALPELASAARRFGSVQATRVNALWGVRSLSFMRVVAFDALTAVQDVQVGFQAGASVGRSLAALDSDEDDLFVSGGMYAGFGSPRSFVQLAAQIEGRQDFNNNDRWDGVLTAGRLGWYGHVVPRHTWVASTEWAAGWNPRVPLALELGAVEGGIRGYRRSGVVGERRLVGRLENRWYLGQYQRTAQFGVAAFTDVGKVWAGDALFGQTTPVKVGLGASLLVALPPRSQRMWRLDLAAPLTADTKAGFEIRLTSTFADGRAWRTPSDLQRSQAFAVPQSVFTWP